MIKPSVARDGKGVIQVDCDTCIGGAFYVPYKDKIPATADILAEGKAQGWDVSNVDLLRCPLCVAEGVIEAF